MVNLHVESKRELMTVYKKQYSRGKFAVALLIGCVYMVAVGLTGCTEEPVASNPGTAEPTSPQVLTETKLQVEASQDPSSAAPVEDKGILESAGDFLQKARSGTGATAIGAKDWVQKKIGDAATASGESASDAMGWANDTFESLKESGLTSADNTSQWLTQDWKNMQSWEYKTMVLKSIADESADDQLNRMGAEGWECFHVDSGTFYFKKPADSYLRHLPFRDVIKLVPLLQQAK